MVWYCTTSKTFENDNLGRKKYHLVGMQILGQQQHFTESKFLGSKIFLSIRIIFIPILYLTDIKMLGNRKIQHGRRVHMHVCVCTHAHARMCVQAFKSLNMCLNAFLYLCTQNKHMHAYKSHLDIDAYTFVYTHTHTFVYTYVYMYVYTHIQTLTYTQIY